MKLYIAKPEHEVAYHDLCNLVAKHADSISALELLAIAGNMIGKLIALQDQRSVTPGQALEIVMKNIEYGNAEAMIEIRSVGYGSVGTA